VDDAPPRATPSGPSRIVVVDDHPIFRQAVKDILSELSTGHLEVVGEARDGQEALELCRRVRPDLVLMDIRMPGMDGFEATRAIKREFPRTTVLVLTSAEDPNHLLEAIKAGAAGYVLKDLTSHRLTDAIQRALSGDSPLDQKLAMELLTRVVDQMPKEEPTSLSAGRSSKKQHPEPPLLETLTPREVEVLQLVVRGQTNRQIARNLSVVMTTVKHHVQRIIEKLGVSDRTQAAVRAIELGLLDEEQGEN
jgi:two-component system, NarL family, response regulator LiaR